MWLACVKLMPHAPDRIDIRKMVVGGSFWKSSRAFVRCARDISPLSVRYWYPESPSLVFSHSMLPWKCENTSDFADGSSSRTSLSFLSSA